MISGKRRVSVGTFRASATTIKYVNDVLDSGKITYGPYSRKLEHDFSRLHACEQGVLSNSGTSALQVALQALKEIHAWKDGDRVIVPATTFVATPNIVLHNRMEPIFVDVDAHTYNIDPKQVERCLRTHNNIVAIIPVHLFGQAANMSALQPLIKRYGLGSIEDSCEAMYATHFDQPVGSLSDVGCFSMYAAHLLVAGVGGISISNSPDISRKIRSLVNHGISAEQLDNPVGRRFAFESAGHSFRITEMEAALALSQLDVWKTHQRARRRNALHLTHRLSAESRLQLPTLGEGNTHSWMMYPLVMAQRDNGWTQLKDDLVTYLNERDIETRDMLPILYQPMYHYLDPHNYPVSDWLVKSGFYVGIHQDLSIEDIDYMADTILEYFENGTTEGQHAD